MAVDFTLSRSQRDLKRRAREFAREVLRPVVERAEGLPDPQEAFRATRPAYEAAYAAGLTTLFLPRELGGGGLSQVDFLVAVEELCAVDPGFATTLLVNGLALKPLLWAAPDELRDRWVRRATGDPTGRFLAGWAVSERGGTANFDHPDSRAGVQLVATHDRARGEYVLHGEKHWPCNAGGWDLQGADLTVCIVRTDRTAGGTSALSAVVVERGAPGLSFEVIDKLAHRTCQNVTMTFRGVRVPEENVFAHGDGDLLVNRAFTWSGPIAGIAAVGVARAAFEFTLKWARTFTGGGSAPVIEHQAVGNLLADVAARIEAARYLCWKAAHYLDRHDGQGQALAGMSKTFCTELVTQVVNDCMRVVGVNALDRRFPMERLYREAAVFPLYDAGNLAMQRRRTWGVMTDPGYTPDVFADGDPLPFTRSMEGIGTVPGVR